jgi:hypothetical protein
MELLRMLLSRCTALFRTRALDKDLEDELRSHLDFAITENMERGMSEAEARQAALREFGGVTQIGERYRVHEEYEMRDWSKRLGERRKRSWVR